MHTASDNENKASIKDWARTGSSTVIEFHQRSQELTTSRKRSARSAAELLEASKDAGEEKVQTTPKLSKHAHLPSKAVAPSSTDPQNDFSFELSNFQSASIEEVVEFYKSSLTNGMTVRAAALQLEKDGSNILPPPYEMPLWLRFLECFARGFNLCLMTAALFVFLSWQPFCPECIFNLVLSIVLMGVVILSTTFTFFQEVLSARVVASFKSVLPSNAIFVIRGGNLTEVSAANLVVGDIVQLNTGMRIPADIRVFKCSNLKLDKSMLTGETEPFSMTSAPSSEEVSFLEARNVAFMGSMITEGEGTGIVIATGAATQLAKISESVTNAETKPSTLQMDLDRFVIIIGSFAMFWTVGVILDWIFYLNEEHPGFMKPNILIANAIGVLVALVPQGLPVAMNIGLSVISKRLFNNHHLVVKQSTAIETFGSITFLGSDKTGTLTQNKMTVVNTITPASNKGGDISNKDAHNAIDKKMIKTAILCNQAKINKAEYNQIIGGNGVDKALMAWGMLSGLLDAVLDNNILMFMMPFSSATKIAAAVIYDQTAEVVEVLIKGAPEYVMDRCSHYLSPSGEALPFTSKARSQLEEYIADESKCGRRVICSAFASLPPDQFTKDFKCEVDPNPNFPLTELTLTCAFVVSDPPRAGVFEAISELRGAGIQLAMITGDASLTATAIAKDVGIISAKNVLNYAGEVLPEGAAISDVESNTQMVDLKKVDPTSRSALVIEGRFIDAIDTEGWNYIFQFKELVFARTTPEHKLQIVIEAQRRDHIVAVTGDGTNDAPALRRANIGVAMGSGSAVARDAALSILLDDQFTAIVSAVEEGRALFANLRKVIAYQISGGCFGELLPVLATFFLGMPTPINSLMMVMVCVTNDTFSGIALMCEPPQNHMMLDKPRDRKETPLVTLKLVNYAYFFMAIIQSIGMFGTYFLYMYERGPVNDVPTPLPADDEGDVEFPIGYTPAQLIGAWNWGLNDGELGEDMMDAAATGSSVFFTALMVSQWAHLISVRNKAPYFYDSIMNVHHSPHNILVRMFKELTGYPPRWQIVLAMSLGAAVANFFSETPPLHEPCQTGSVSARYWGVALLFGLFVFVCGEIRKWMITIWPNCWLGRVTEC